MLKLILIIVGVICLFLAGLNVSSPRFSFGWLGLAFLAAGLYLPL